MEEFDDESLNEYLALEERPIPFKRMVYIADGITDVPCMRLVKTYGGKSMVVYDPSSEKAYHTANKLIEDGRANFMSVANYEEGSDMEQLMKKILMHMHADLELEERDGKVYEEN